ncbi:MAG TPA: PP2C family protein-serine/threonine phosphatase [Acidobacteriaceae bacterium]|nr:PP2C family protein-serine/threonine phosphatase [Acidobacteriaceae bacterium]
MPGCSISGLARLLLLLTLLAASAPLHAQTLTQSWTTLAPSQCVWHAGDDPAWAAPTFDDSAWQPYSAWKIDEHTPYIWVRCHASLAWLGTLDHPALEVHLHAASQVFVNGALAGSSGDLTSGRFSMGDFFTVTLPPASLTPAATLALRIALRDLQNQTTPAEIFLGDEQALRDRRAAAALSGALDYLPIALCFSLIGVVGFMLLGLWVTDRSRIELLLLAIVCWFLCDLRLSEFCLNALVPMSSAFYNVLNASGQFLLIPWLLFLFRIAGKRVPWFYWVATLVATAYFVAGLVADAFLPAALNLRQDALYNSLAGYMFPLATVCVTAPLAAFWPLNRIPRRLRAVAFFCIAWGGAEFLWFSSWESLILGLLSDAQTAHVQKYLLILRATTTLCSVLALLTILFREQRRIAEDRALLAGEMQAARDIQSLLAPATLDTIPGLHVDVAFHPMRDVGGDFYLCRPLPDGRQRILVGDVSGKGTAAAMTATLLIGAAEQRDTDSPAALLRHLNNVLRLSRVGGFATCLCADIARDGSVTLANAGHLPPYCRSQEIPIVSCLPLGLSEPTEAAYEESRFTLRPGDTLTFVSDGVAEARNFEGELFGFERTRAVSNLSAEQIAQAAQAHGQHDDITVLTLQFTPSAVPA